MNSKRGLRVSNQCTNIFLTSNGDVFPNSQSGHIHAVFLVKKCGGVRNIKKLPHALISLIL